MVSTCDLLKYEREEGHEEKPMPRQAAHTVATEVEGMGEAPIDTAVMTYR